jgi:hypothetical protein
MPLQFRRMPSPTTSAGILTVNSAIATFDSGLLLLLLGLSKNLEVSNVPHRSVVKAELPEKPQARSMVCRPQVAAAWMGLLVGVTTD